MKGPTRLVLAALALGTGALLVWPREQPAPAAPASTVAARPASLTEGRPASPVPLTDGRPAPPQIPADWKTTLHPAAAPYAFQQRLWWAAWSGDPAPLRLAPGETFPPDQDANLALLQLLRARVLGETPPPPPDEGTGAAAEWLATHPETLADALRIKLAFRCEQDLRHGPDLTGRPCPLDASALSQRDAATGKAVCPLQEHPVHSTFGGTRLMMLFDIMASARTGDVERLQRVFPLKPGMDVLDLGAGVGAYTIPWAQVVGPQGTVHAEDLDQEVMDYVAFRARHAGLSNVKTWVGDTADLRMPAGVADVAFLVDVHPCTENPASFFRNPFPATIHQTLRPGGRMVIITSVDTPHAEAYAEALRGKGFELERTVTEDQGAGRSREIVVFRRLD